MSRDIVQIWLHVEDGFVELSDDDHNLDWYGIDDGSNLFVYITVQ